MSAETATTTAPSSDDLPDDVDALKARIRMLEAELAQYRRPKADPAWAADLRTYVAAGMSWADIGAKFGITGTAAWQRADGLGLVKKPADKKLSVSVNERGNFVVGGKERVPIPDAALIENPVMQARALRYNAWCLAPAERLAPVAKELGLPLNELCRQVKRLKDDRTYVPKPGTPRAQRRKQPALEA